jgi:hypothetical protein
MLPIGEAAQKLKALEEAGGLAAKIELYRSTK